MTTFHSGPPPEGFKPDFESFLFNTSAHRKLQSKTGWVEFHMLDRGRRKILSSIFFHVKGIQARSPFKAPFGSFEISKVISQKQLAEFLIFIEQYFLKEKIHTLELVCPPELYQMQQPIITTTLFNHGYTRQTEPGCCIVVDDEPLALKLKRDKQVRLKKSEKANLAYQEIPLSRIGNVYTFIDTHYKKLGRKLSMTRPQLIATAKRLPDSFFLVGVFLNKKLTAACICIKINKSIVYTFYSAHSDVYNKFSPRVLMLKHLYDWCHRHQVTLLDLGTSALYGQANSGLLDFKLRVGGTPTPKHTFQKTLRP